MNTVPLGDLMLTRNGSVNPADSSDELFELYSIPAHDQGGAEPRVGSSIRSAKQLVEPGDVLLSKIVPHIRRTRVVSNNSGQRQIASGEWIIFRDPSIHPPFLAHMLTSDEFHGHFMATVAGIGGSLNRARPQHVRSIQVPLPALHEQQRIAAILDQADALRTEARRVELRLDEYVRSAFHEHFGQLVPDATLGEHATIQGGLQVSAKRAGLPRETAYLRVANVHRGRLSLEHIRTLRATDAEIARTKLVAGDLLFVEGHANPLEIGRVALWNGSVENCVHQNHLIRARMSDRICPEFAAAWFNSPAGARHFQRAGRTTSGLSTISSATVKSAPLPLPPIVDQQRFGSIVVEAGVARAQNRSRLNLLDELFTSLQSRAFSGEL